MFIFFWLRVLWFFSRLKMKTLHGGLGEHRSHLHVAVFFLGGGGSFFLFRLGVRLRFFLSSGVFFVPSEYCWRENQGNITKEGGNCTKNPVSLLFHF